MRPARMFWTGCASAAGATPGLDIPEPKNDRVAFLKEYVEMLKSQEAFEERMVKSRLSGVENLLRAQYDRIEGEMLLKQEELKR